MTFDKVTDVARLTGCEFFRLGRSPIILKYSKGLLFDRKERAREKGANRTVWTPTQEDLIATDWEVIPMGEE